MAQPKPTFVITATLAFSISLCFGLCALIWLGLYYVAEMIGWGLAMTIFFACAIACAFGTVAGMAASAIIALQRFR